AFGAGGRSWLNFNGFTPNTLERLDRLIGHGAVPKAIAVCPDGWTRLGGSQWVNSAATGRYADFLGRDVVGAVDAAFRTRARASARAVMGTSSGGYGALVAAREFPDVFGHLACHSGDAYFEYCYLPDLPKAAGAFLAAGGPERWFAELERRAQETQMRGGDHAVLNALAMAAAYSPRPGVPLNLELPFDEQTARIRPEIWEQWLAHDPVRFIPQYADRFRRLQTVFVDCGTQDEFNLRWGARIVAGALREAGGSVTHEEFQDGHRGVAYRHERSLTLLLNRMTSVEA
ncbi:MAG TPA: alpha/beta hydrolase-fold protein, partial [Myxococcaceae bacterium]|nr:alpha/beta hydrolase-fold protein [Myxococcaceae bacterium]